MPRSSADAAMIDDLDRQILYAVQIEPRVAFSEVADVLGVSEQTVARRFRRMHAAGVVRVLGLVNPSRLGRTDWVVRVRVRPDAVTALADALARRDDVSWVTLLSGGSEIMCITRPDSDDQRDELLLQRLPRTAPVLGFSAQALLHRFGPATGPDWTGYADTLSDEQVARLARREGPPRDDAMTLEPGDAPLVAALRANGRASYAELAKATGWTPSRAARRLEGLRANGVLYFDVELAQAMIGFTALAFMWLSVAPSDLEATGQALIRHRQVAFCGAITGAANLMTALVCRDSADLYRYVTDDVGAIETIRQVEISPVLRRLKQAGTLMVGPRLVSEGPPAPGRPARQPGRPPGRMAGSGRGLTGS
jgi:DNA-binding Lrp family transcriptional regulator